MKVVFEQRTWKGMDDDLAVSPGDDAWHPHEGRNYLEWWYFDVMGEDGSIVRGDLSLARISKVRRVLAGVRASYVKPDGTEISIEEMFPLAAFSASTEVCEVKIGGNYLRGDLSHYELHMEDADKSLDLVLDSDIQGIKSRACFGDESRYMYWVVPQPRGRASGTLRTSDGTLEIRGVGYRDHNWLNFFPMDVLAYWDWGRVYDKEFTVMFADIVANGKFENAEVKPLVVYDSTRLLYLTSELRKWSLTKMDMAPDPATGEQHPRRHVLRARDDDMSLDIDLRLDRVFQRIDLLADFNPLLRWFIRTFRGKPSITSFHSVGSGKLGLAGRECELTCSAVHEFVKNT